MRGAVVDDPEHAARRAIGLALHEGGYQMVEGRDVGFLFAPAEDPCCLVFEFKDGRVTDGREHFFDLYAWDKFWS